MPGLFVECELCADAERAIGQTVIFGKVATLTNQCDEKDEKGYLYSVVRRAVLLGKGARIDVCTMGCNGGGRYESDDSAVTRDKLKTQCNVGVAGYGVKGERYCRGKGFGVGAAKSKHIDGTDGEGGAEYGDAREGRAGKKFKRVLCDGLRV